MMEQGKIRFLKNDLFSGNFSMATNQQQPVRSKETIYTYDSSFKNKIWDLQSIQ